MAKAETGTGGSVVGELAYRNDYISARASAKLAEETWQRNKCVASVARRRRAGAAGSAPRRHPARVMVQRDRAAPSIDAEAAPACSRRCLHTRQS